VKAYVTSIGESTTDLCVWSLERQGLEVTVISSPNTSLSFKLARIYEEVDEDFLRVDADVIVNHNILKLPDQTPKKLWWVQGLTFDWFKQDTTHGGVNFYRKEALPDLRKTITDYALYERPETEASRIEAFYNPRRFDTIPLICGLHGYKQYDVERVVATKSRRNQLPNYDFELALRISEL
jgi:hypothetical protein